MYEPEDRSQYRKGCSTEAQRIAYGFRVREELGVDLVHCGKVVHVGEKDVDLDGFCETGAAGFENSATEPVVQQKDSPKIHWEILDHSQVLQDLLLHRLVRFWSYASSLF